MHDFYYAAYELVSNGRQFTKLTIISINSIIAKASQIFSFSVLFLISSQYFSSLLLLTFFLCIFLTHTHVLYTQMHTHIHPKYNSLMAGISLFLELSYNKLG